MGKPKKAKPPEPVNQRKEVKAVYIGRRLWDCGMVRVFLCGNAERGFRMSFFAEIGMTYLIYDTGCPRRPKQVESLKDGAILVTKQEVAAWEVEDAVAVETAEHNRRARRFAKDPRFLRNFDELKAACKGLNYRDQKHLVEFLVRRLTLG